MSFETLYFAQLLRMVSTVDPHWVHFFLEESTTNFQICFEVCARGNVVFAAVLYFNELILDDHLSALLPDHHRPPLHPLQAAALVVAVPTVLLVLLLPLVLVWMLEVMRNWATAAI